MKACLLLFITCLCFIISCKDENGSVTPLADDVKIEKLIESIDPYIQGIQSKLGRDDAYVISFEVVKNKKTGEIALLNFAKVETFPLISENEARSAEKPKKYQVGCTKGGVTTSKECDGKISCGTAVVNCLDKGGCTTICTKPFQIDETLGLDALFFENEGYEVDEINEVLGNFSVTEFQEAKESGDLASVTMQTLIY